MLPIAADENFNNDILRGLRRQEPELDVVRVQDIPGLQAADDPDVLAWAAAEGRVLLTHDVNTMKGYVEERQRAGAPLAGVILVKEPCDIGAVIDDIRVVLACSQPSDWEAEPCRFLPFRQA